MDSIKPEKKNLASDLVAGLTFALVNIPQSMAHALLAAVNPVFGLYTLMLATPVGALFTSAIFMNVSTLPRTLPSLVLPDLKLILKLIIPAVAIGIIGLVQGASVSQIFPNCGGGTKY